MSLLLIICLTIRETHDYRAAQMQRIIVEILLGIIFLFPSTSSALTLHRSISMTSLPATEFKAHGNAPSYEKLAIMIIDHGSRVASANDMLLEVNNSHFCSSFYMISKNALDISIGRQGVQGVLWKCYS